MATLLSNIVTPCANAPGVCSSLQEYGFVKVIRKYLIDNNYVECVIQLPDNLFFGTSIAACIVVLKKNKVENSTLFIDVSKECVKITNNNKLTEENILNILAIFEKRENKQYYAAVAENDKFAGNSYNLSVLSYVKQEYKGKRLIL